MEQNKITSNREEIEIKPDGEMSEEKSCDLMLYDIRQMIKEINNFTKKSRYRSLTVTALEEAENWLAKDLKYKYPL